MVPGLHDPEISPGDALYASSTLCTREDVSVGNRFVGQTAPSPLQQVEGAPRLGEHAVGPHRHLLREAVSGEGLIVGGRGEGGVQFPRAQAEIRTRP